MYSAELKSVIWDGVLKDYCHCYADSVGNRPCDNGAVCDRCESFDVVCPYEVLCQSALNLVKRFEVGETYEVIGLYGGDCRIKIIERSEGLIKYVDEGCTIPHVEQVLYHSYHDGNQRVYVEALLAWEYTPCDHNGVPFDVEPERCYFVAG